MNFTKNEKEIIMMALYSNACELTNKMHKAIDLVSDTRDLAKTVEYEMKCLINEHNEVLKKVREL